MNFTEAYNHMRQVGMFKGSAYGPGDSVCALGACSEVGVPIRDLPILDAVAREQFSERISNPNRRSVVDVNDHPDTTIDDMRVIFEKAQMRLDEKV